MDFGAYISIGCVLGAVVGYTWLTIYNLKVLRGTKKERIEQRRRERILKRPWWYATVKAELDRRKGSD